VLCRKRGNYVYVVAFHLCILAVGHFFCQRISFASAKRTAAKLEFVRRDLAPMTDEIQPTPPRKGILVTRGVTPSFPPGAISIKINEDGSHSMSARLHLHYDVCPTWLELAVGHLISAEEHHNILLANLSVDSRKVAGEALDLEFRAAMQAGIAASISLDALYANVKETITSPDDVRRAWTKRKTSRPARVAEVFRRGFSIKHSTADRVREVLVQIYGFRDLTVHPSGQSEEAVLHPDVGAGVEWRFVAFSFTNVKEVVAGCLSMVAQLVNKPKRTNKRLIHYCDGVRPRIDVLVKEWEKRYEQLYERPN
jgi:hypothetical protein